MKALSIDAEYAWRIHEGEKNIECRTWKTDYRGPLLICASKMPVPGFISGHAVCVVDLVDIVPFAEEHLDGALMDEMPEGKAWAWVLDNPQEIQPFPVRGKLHLYDVDDTLIKYMVTERAEALSQAAFDLYADKFYLAYEFPLLYMPGKHNDAYNTAIELGNAYRNNPELLFAPDPLPLSLLDSTED